jgi:GntR family transcriptional regulator
LSASRFLYEDVAAELRRRIDAGAYGPGARIPTEAELTREFGVSAITIRRAIRDLCLEGRLVARQGLGVFVVSARRITRTLRLNTTTSIADEIRRAGLEPGLRELTFARVAADPEVASRLDAAEGSMVYLLERVILADGEPVGIDTAWLPRPLGERLGPAAARQFMMPLLLARRIAIDHVDFQIQGGVVSDRQAGPMGLPVGFPLLVVDYTAIGPTGAAALAGRTAARADRFAYEFCGRPEVHRGAR